MKYLIVIEETSTGYSAYSPDLMGCAATGASRDAVEQAVREAIASTWKVCGRKTLGSPTRIVIRRTWKYSHAGNDLSDWEYQAEEHYSETGIPLFFAHAAARFE